MGGSAGDDAQCCAGVGLCSSDHYNFSGGFASKHQADAISKGAADPRSPSTDAEDCDYGDTYDFLKGVSDQTSTRFYKHYGVNASGQVVLPVYVRLPVAVIAVFHREHWYKRYSNSLDLSDRDGGSDIDRDAARCMSPLWWAFGCTGVWITSGEVKSSTLDAQFGAGTADAVLIKVNAGDPVPEAWLDHLESEGLLGPVKDWESSGKLIKKELVYYNAFGSNPQTTTEYFFGRPGGWTYICSGVTETDLQTYLDDYWPQIPRRSTTNCTVLGASDCFTSAPIPGNNCVSCDTFAAYSTGLPSGCDHCSGSMGDCDPPLLSSCGSDGLTCFGDLAVSSCVGVWGQYWEVILPSPTGSLSLNYSCKLNQDVVPAEEFNSYLARIPSAGTTPVWPDLPDDIRHQIPATVSGSVRNGTSDGAKLCCGGEGTVGYGSVDCPASGPNAGACDEPPSWGPGL